MSAEPCAIRGVEAVIFDMDGTLVDSEPFTAVSVEALLAAEGIEDPDLPKVQVVEDEERRN